MQTTIKCLIATCLDCLDAPLPTKNKKANKAHHSKSIGDEETSRTSLSSLSTTLDPHRTINSILVESGLIVTWKLLSSQQNWNMLHILNELWFEMEPGLRKQVSEARKRDLSKRKHQDRSTSHHPPSEHLSPSSAIQIAPDKHIVEPFLTLELSLASHR